MAQYYSEKKHISNKRWDDANLFHLSVIVPKGTKDRIVACGLPINRFVTQAVMEKLCDDGVIENPDM